MSRGLKESEGGNHSGKWEENVPGRGNKGPGGEHTWHAAISVTSRRPMDRVSEGRKGEADDRGLGGWSRSSVVPGQAEISITWELVKQMFASHPRPTKSNSGGGM